MSPLITRTRALVISWENDKFHSLWRAAADVRAPLKMLSISDSRVVSAVVKRDAEGFASPRDADPSQAGA